MVKSRRSAVFATDKLKYFVDDSTYRRTRGVRAPERLVAEYGSTEAPAETFSYDEEAYFSKRRMSQAK